MLNPQPIPSYLIQSEAVRERFDRLKSREVILEVRDLDKRFESAQG